MKKYIITLIALALTFTAFAQSEATYNYLDRTYTLNADGSTDQRVSSSMTIKTYLALNSLFGETFIEYNPEFQTVTINDSYTRQADGTIIRTPDNALNEVLPSSAANAPAYNSLKELVITHTGLELGATIYLDYTIHTSPQMTAGNLEVYCMLPQLFADIRKGSITINVPDGKTLRFCTADTKLKPAVNGGSYKWNFSNLAEYDNEPYQSALFGKARLYASTAKDDSPLARITYDTRDIYRLNSKLTDGKSQEDKIEAIASYVNSQTALTPVSLSTAGYRHAYAAETDRRAYGSALDRVILLNKLLSSEGMESRIYAVYPKDATVRPIDGIVSLAVCATTADGKKVWLDAAGNKINPERQSAQYDYISLSKLEPETLETTTVKSSLKSVVTLAEGKATSENTLKLNDKERTTNGTPSVVQSGLYTILTLANYSEGVPNLNPSLLNTKRTTTFELPYAFERNETFKVTSDKQIVSAPSHTSIKNAVGSLEITVTVNGNNATITRSIAFDKAVVPPSQWAQARALLTGWYNNAPLKIAVK